MTTRLRVSNRARVAAPVFRERDFLATRRAPLRECDVCRDIRG
jgi:hypothetical protein